MQIEEEQVGRMICPVEPAHKGKKVERVGQRLGIGGLGLVEDSLVGHRSWGKP